MDLLWYNIVFFFFQLFIVVSKKKNAYVDGKAAVVFKIKKSRLRSNTN